MASAAGRPLLCALQFFAFARGHIVRWFILADLVSVLIPVSALKRAIVAGDEPAIGRTVGAPQARSLTTAPQIVIEVQPQPTMTIPAATSIRAVHR
jgi:hypothetical protein